MSEEPPPPIPADQKSPLEYRNYSDDRPERRKLFQTFLQGLLIGIFLTVLIGFITLFGTLQEVNTTTKPTGHSPIVAVFAFLAAAAGVAGFFALRGSRRRFFLGGFLLGVALTCMIEGICFSG